MYVHSATHNSGSGTYAYGINGFALRICVFEHWDNHPRKKKELPANKATLKQARDLRKDYMKSAVHYSYIIQISVYTHANGSETL